MVIAPGPSGTRFFVDAASAKAVAAKCQDLPNDGHLHYTRGTKVMSAHARMAFAAAGFGPEECSYLDVTRD